MRLPGRGARSARPSAAASSSAPQRIVRRDEERLARVETLDSGKPLRELLKVDVETTARLFRILRRHRRQAAGRHHSLSGPIIISFTLHEPVGVTAHIIPWNFPLVTTARGVAPALAAGNAAIVKPAEETPLTALILARSPGGGRAAARRL